MSNLPEPFSGEGNAFTFVEKGRLTTRAALPHTHCKVTSSGAVKSFTWRLCVLGGTRVL